MEPEPDLKQSLLLTVGMRSVAEQPTGGTVNLNLFCDCSSCYPSTTWQEGVHNGDWGQVPNLDPQTQLMQGIVWGLVFTGFPRGVH